jgi:RNA polymerase subunit RPABC4/transcription elongation factor Spt4
MEMPNEAVSAIELKSAYFCLNCEVITDRPDICPVCGYGQLWNLEHWLGRANGIARERRVEDKAIAPGKCNR